jgi:Peptidase family M50
MRSSVKFVVVISGHAYGRTRDVGEGVRRGKWGWLFWLELAFLAGIGAIPTYLWLRAHWWLIFWCLCGLALGVVWHEAGHFLCARLCAVPVRRVSIGIGPRLARFRLGEVQFDLRLLPLGGRVAISPPLAARKLAMLLFLLGGVLGNVALLALVMSLAATGARPEHAGTPLKAIIGVQLFLVAVSLLPFRVKVDGVEVGSDGLQLLQLLWSPRAEPTEAARLYAEMLAAYSSPNAPRPVTSPAAARLIALINDPRQWGDADATRTHLEALEHELAGNLSLEEELLALDSLITIGLILGDPPLRARLDQWSRRALQLGPHIPTLRGSRGAVLVELGRCEEGKALLAGFAVAEGSFDAFMNHVYLARAEHALTNRAAAVRFAEAARKTAALHPQVPGVRLLLRRLEAQLGIDQRRWR